jgi:hypothetical protein
MECIHVSEDRVQWQIHVNTEIFRRDKSGTFLDLPSDCQLLMKDFASCNW